MNRVQETCLVVRAGSLVGSAVAVRLSARMRVVAIDGDLGADDLRDRLIGQGAHRANLQVLDHDVTTPAGRAALSELTAPDHLVIGDPPSSARPLDRTTEDDWLTADDAGPRATYFLLRDLCGRMPAHGAVVVVTSVAGKSARNPEIIPYSAGQAATLSLVRSFANLHAATGPRVNAICTGIIDGPDNEQYLQTVARSRGIRVDELARTRFSVVPMGRAGTAEHCAGTVDYLLSPAAGFVTGQSINVTGGFHQQ